MRPEDIGSTRSTVSIASRSLDLFDSGRDFEEFLPSLAPGGEWSYYVLVHVL